jgi:hypothetical protein
MIDKSDVWHRINELVNQLYGLTEKEIEIIESK